MLILFISFDIHSQTPDSSGKLAKGKPLVSSSPGDTSNFISAKKINSQQTQSTKLNEGSSKSKIQHPLTTNKKTN